MANGQSEHPRIALVRKFPREGLAPAWSAGVLCLHYPCVLKATAAGVAERDELLRLVVHGVLHALGYEHPEGATRTLSTMWRVQERHLRRLSEDVS